MAETPTTNHSLSKQDFKDPAWHTLLNSTLDKIDTKLPRAYAGNPNTNVAGDYIGQPIFDSTNKKLYICTTTGIAAAAVWIQYSQLLALAQSKGSAIASSGTTAIGAADSDFVSITGTTTITSFDTPNAVTGRKHVWLQFDGILTLTHHATSLILPGGANITTAAGDTALMVHVSGANWKCAAYIRASGLSVVPQAAGDMYGANNLSELTDASAARTNLGLGTSAILDTGTTADKVVKLDSSAKLPAVDGSQLTNLPVDPPVTTYQEVGTYGIFKFTGASVAAGATTAGSNLQRTYFTADAVPVLTASATSPAGTWRNMGDGSLTTNQFGLFIRTA